MHQFLSNLSSRLSSAGIADTSTTSLSLSCILFVSILVFLLIIKFIAKSFYKNTSDKHSLRKDFFEKIANISIYSCIIFPIFFSSLLLELPKSTKIIIAFLFIIAIVVEVSALSKIILKIIIEKGFKNQDLKTKKNLNEILNTILQIFIRILAALTVFDTVGIAITPFLTSLGIGGIAVAFAAQKLLEDFFSSFSIMGSSPFRIGDRISVSGYSGTVKKIGLRTTTLQTVEGAVVVIPNRTVVSDIIENSGMIKVRRKRFSLTVTYETPVQKLRMIPSLLKEIINKQEKTVFEWALLKDLQDSSIQILVSYTITNDDLIFSFKVHDSILLEILKCFEKEGIDFAYPTQTIYTKK